MATDEVEGQTGLRGGSGRLAGRRWLRGRGGAEEDAHLGAAKDADDRSRAAALAPGIGATRQRTGAAG
ncbi:hypothetical protein E2562_015498 [Oryza meyeriana var. granulata]|uniref:DUF834 domain-containing protein n=1 Tax=Oryza meyeriana var. granulata TaxID=110450 RepID=A0A6G1CQ47_9ORYZ|nr:hypothetical protein E2562_015498 [Oryza meyeriana var. granulata]